MTYKSLNNRQSLRSWSGWTVYLVGWIVWFASMPLKADYPLLGLGGGGIPSYIPSTAHPGPVFGEMIGGGECIPTKYLNLAFLLWLAYIVGVLISAFWSLIRKGPKWLDIVGRICVLGILAVWSEVAYASQYVNFRLLPGYPILAIASTLICLGVWLFPPRSVKLDLAKNSNQDTTEKAFGDNK